MPVLLVPMMPITNMPNHDEDDDDDGGTDDDTDDDEDCGKVSDEEGGVPALSSVTLPSGFPLCFATPMYANVYINVHQCMPMYAKWLSINIISIMLCNTNVCQCVHQCIPMYTNVRTPMYAKWLSINIISIILCNTNVPIYVRSCVSNVCHALAPTGTLYVIMIQAAVHLKFNEMFQPTALYSQCNLFMIYCNH